MEGTQQEFNLQLTVVVQHRFGLFINGIRDSESFTVAVLKVWRELSSEENGRGCSWSCCHLCACSHSPPCGWAHVPFYIRPASFVPQEKGKGPSCIQINTWFIVCRSSSPILQFLHRARRQLGFWGDNKLRLKWDCFVAGGLQEEEHNHSERRRQLQQWVRKYQNHSILTPLSPRPPSAPDDLEKIREHPVEAMFDTRSIFHNVIEELEASQAFLKSEQGSLWPCLTSRLGQSPVRV